MSAYEKAQQALREEPKTWLVTGAAGFIGSNLVEALLKLNQRVVGLDNFATGYRHNIDAALEDAGVDPETPLFRFIEGDICSLDDCHKACEGVDYVLHQAAIGSVPRSIEDPITTHRVNLDGFVNMLVAARDAKVERFVYASSSSVYGDEPTLPKVEDRVGNPLSPYAVTKCANEQYARVFSSAYDIATVGLRYFNIFGKRQDPNGAYAAVIPRWIQAMLDGRRVVAYGDGETSRDFCYVANAIQANLLAAFSRVPSAARVYNVACHERTSLNHLFELLRSRLSANLTAAESCQLQYESFRPGDIRHSLANVDLIRDELGYEATDLIEPGLDRYCRWFTHRE